MYNAMHISLKDIDTGAPDGLTKKGTKKKTKAILKKFGDLQNLLYAQKKYAILVVIQGMDASGKDGTLKNVFNHFNPRNLNVHSFDVPTAEEAAHDFLWRAHKFVPAKGMIEIFNRSYYEDVLVTRVHNLCSDEKAKERMKEINNFESLLEHDNNTHILKFYLHVSKQEQEKRLQERVEKPSKHWKYDANDYKEVALRDEYINMYEDVFKHCNHPGWRIVPADHNWVKEYLIANALLEALESLKMEYPDLEKL